MKTHPLKPASISALKLLNDGRARPTQEFNSGVIDRLLRDGFIEIKQYLSPYARSKGQTIPHARITFAGRDRVALGFEQERVSR